ncbi:hypothetical protein CC78DRAFT_588288 [Lojkania enalia]|uniref:Uncharacterized protein n=1 Tax=Lojkania enalia TaxID=147567 RepID=A0A9P4JXN8_9PLEO|nr:hypothetical protein CC78DRAFT_588288 [Didymosphaeria enalia]
MVNHQKASKQDMSLGATVYKHAVVALKYPYAAVDFAIETAENKDGSLSNDGPGGKLLGVRRTCQEHVSGKISWDGSNKEVSKWEGLLRWWRFGDGTTRQTIE